MAAALVPVASIELVEAALEGQIRAIARLLTRVENGGDEVMEALGAIYPHTGKAHIIGITGVPGSGKSTLLHLLAGLDRPDHHGGDHTATSPPPQPPA